MKNKNLFFLFIFSLFLQCASESRRAEYSIVERVDFFSGKNIRDSDITIHSHKEKGLISVSGNKERFVFLLPYSEDWKVKYTDNSYIQMDSEQKNLLVSITTEKRNKKDVPEQFLKELKSRVESRIGVKLQDTRIISGSSNKILAYFFETDYRGLKVKSDNFWSVRQRSDNVLIKLHLSTINVPEKDIANMEKPILIFMDTGFRILNDEDFI